MSHTIPKAVTWLRALYAVALLLLPVYSVLFIVYSPLTADALSDSQISFLASTYFLVVLFNLFMLVLRFKDLPHTMAGMLNVLLTPVVVIVLHTVLDEGSVAMAIASLGMVYAMSMMVAYAGLVFVGPYLAGKVRSVRDAVSAFGLGLTQLLFIIPGIGAVVIFSEVLLKTQIWPAYGEAEPYSPMLVLSYALLIGAVVQNAWTVAKEMRKNSVLA